MCHSGYVGLVRLARSYGPGPPLAETHGLVEPAPARFNSLTKRTLFLCLCRASETRTHGLFVPNSAHQLAIARHRHKREVILNSCVENVSILICSGNGEMIKWKLRSYSFYPYFMETAHLALFKGRGIRKTVFQNEWWFSVVDVVGALTDSVDPRGYWFKMKVRVKAEDGIQLSTICRQLKLESSDGKKYQTDRANTAGVFRIV